MKKLAICIPTYNELDYLKRNLDSLIPQVKSFNKNVDLYVIDNFSNDGTNEYVNKLFDKISNCYYRKNESNIGLHKNQLSCLQIEGYDYKIILGSDDVILENSISEILSHLGNKFSILCMNYFSFKDNYREPYKVYAPENNLTFDRAYDLLNAPTVGHYSAFIFKSEFVDEYLNILIKKYDEEIYIINRGIINFLAAYICHNESNQTFFIGKRCLATNFSKEVTYNSLSHLCIDYLDRYHLLYKDGIGTKNDFLYRKRLISKSILKASLRNLPFMDNKEIISIEKKLLFYFSDSILLKFFIIIGYFLMRISFLKYIAKQMVLIGLKVRDDIL